MRKIARLVGLVLLSASAGWTGCASGPAAPVASPLPKEALVVLSSPDHVEAYRVARLADHPGAGGKVAGFAVLSSLAAPDDVAKQLSAAVTTPANLRDQPAACTFDPFVAYRFYKGNEGVDVLLCFQCDEAMIVERDAHRKEVYRHTWSIAESRATFVKLAKRTFPENAEVTTLPDAR